MDMVFENNCSDWRTDHICCSVVAVTAFPAAANDGVVFWRVVEFLLMVMANDGSKMVKEGRDSI